MPKKYSEKWYIKNADKPQNFFPKEWVQHFLGFSIGFLEDFKTEMDWKSIILYIIKEDYTCSLKKFKKILEISEFDVNTIFENDTAMLPLCIENYKIDFVEHLLKKGANPNIGEDFCGFTSLERSVDSKNFHIVKTLLRHGADPNLILEDGSSVFNELVVGYEGSHIEYIIIESMLKYGANPYYLDSEGDSYHQWYSPGREFEEIYFLLVKYGMKNIEQYNEEQKTLKPKDDTKLGVVDYSEGCLETSEYNSTPENVIRNYFQEVLDKIDVYKLLRHE